jgi:Holliday junction resolvase
MNADFEDFEVEDILKERKKKVDGGRKGKRVERELVSEFTTRFGEGFSRSLGSGNRWGQVKNLPKHAKDTLSGDICCPPGFKWVLESKGGYEGIDFWTIFQRGNSTIDEFLDQVSKDSTRTGRKPMLLYKRDRKPWIAFVPTKELEGREFKYRLIYGKWSAVALKDLFELQDDFFFEEK